MSGAAPPPPPPPPPPGGYGPPSGYGPPDGGWGQPAYGGPPQGPPPANHLVWAILTTVFCCLPFGIASIVYAAQVNSKWAMGDVAGAHDSASKAKKWAIWSAVAGVVITVLFLLLGGLAVVAGSSTSVSTSVG